jgi:T-complex protein 1 subunit gamma
MENNKLSNLDFNLENNEDLQKIVRSTIGTKFSSKWGDLLVDLAVQAVRTVWSKDEQGNIEIDIKRYAKIEKIPGGVLEECEV